MGYYSSMEGTITVTPVPSPTKLDVKKLKTNSHMEWALECIEIKAEKESTTTVEPDGTEVTRTKVVSVQLDACGSSDHKHYYIAEGLQALVDHFGRDRKYEGYFEFRGEDGDQWRFVVVNGEVKEIKPTITWPEA